MIDEKTGLDTDLTVLLDWEFEVPCDVPQFTNIECDRSAEWKMVAVCCGHVFLFCEFHKEGLMASLKTFPDRFYECDVCGDILEGAEHYFMIVERL